MALIDFKVVIYLCGPELRIIIVQNLHDYNCNVHDLASMNSNQENQDATFQTNCEVKCRSKWDGCSIIINSTSIIPCGP